MPLYTFIHNLLSVLVQIADKIGEPNGGRWRHVLQFPAWDLSFILGWVRAHGPYCALAPSVKRTLAVAQTEPGIPYFRIRPNWLLIDRINIRRYAGWATLSIVTRVTHRLTEQHSTHSHNAFHCDPFTRFRKKDGICRSKQNLHFAALTLPRPIKYLLIKLSGLSQRVNYIDRATAACGRS
jgi:hypothetical protein